MPRIVTTTAGQTNLDVPVSTRAAKVDYTAARAVLLDALDANITTRAAIPAAATTFTVTDIGNVPAGTVVATTGALAAGEYEVIVSTSYVSGTDTLPTLQHRNAADTGNIAGRTYQLAGGATVGQSSNVWWPRITVALNERFRIVTVSAGGGATSQFISFFVRLAV